MRQWLARARRPWRDVLAHFRAAGEGLAAAHDAGLVHRDFKPDNVLLVDHGVRVGDFGLVSASGRVPEDLGAAGAPDGELQTQAGTVLGTPGYMAPEQVRGEPVGPAADQFAFCVTLWEALYGVRPFPRAQAQLLDAVALGPAPPPPSEIPGVVRAALERGLKLDVAERWPSMHDLLATLDAALGPAARSGATGPASRRSRRMTPPG
jgi:serine/threonine protein kinase